MIGKPAQLVQWLFNQPKDKDFEVKEHKKRRSLNANNYAWALITKIANNIPQTSKEEVYLRLLKSYGQSTMISVLAEVNIEGYFKYYEVKGQSYLKGRLFNHIVVYKGSSEYNTHEMALFIDGIVAEAKNMGIEVLTPAELFSLKENWKQ